MRRIAILAGVVLALAVAACGSDNGPRVATANGAAAAQPTPTATADRQEQLRAFTQCMRDNGVDMPDPDPNGSLDRPGGLDLNDPALKRALTACQAKLPNGGEVPKLDPQQSDQYMRFAACMREHGVDLPDPGPDGTLPLGQAAGSLLGDPDFQPALQACRDTLTALRSSAPTP
jgi:hypothetical protein